ncbi:hypothetical protein Barb4_04022 [Bacteroidales bacterium Barb4]|nr:hypothetical protein Barb4_04022 [Bacteroidales bacterium Barb4]
MKTEKAAFLPPIPYPTTNIRILSELQTDWAILLPPPKHLVTVWIIPYRNYGRL